VRRLDLFRADQGIVPGIVLQEELDQHRLKPLALRHSGVPPQVGASGDAPHDHLKRDHTAAADKVDVVPDHADKVCVDALRLQQVEHVRVRPTGQGTLPRKLAAACAIPGREAVLVHHVHEVALGGVAIEDLGLALGELGAELHRSKGHGRLLLG